MANTQNLQPRPPFTSEEAKELQKKSVKSRKKNKTIRESMIAALDMPVTDKKQLAMIAQAGLPAPKKPTYKDFLVASAVLKTIKNGKMADIEALMRIVGESDDVPVCDPVNIIIDV